MNEPATKEDLEKARDAIIVRIEAMDGSVKGMREQNSQEHGSLFTKQSYVIYMINWLRDSWRRFGILSPPPAEPSEPPKPPKDDTQ